MSNYLDVFFWIVLLLKHFLKYMEIYNNVSRFIIFKLFESHFGLFSNKCQLDSNFLINSYIKVKATSVESKSVETNLCWSWIDFNNGWSLYEKLNRYGDDKLMIIKNFSWKIKQQFRRYIFIYHRQCFLRCFSISVYSRWIINQSIKF